VIKTLFVGVWVCAVALGSTYLAAHMAAAVPAGEGAKGAPAVEYIKSEMLSVPVIRGGKVQGYVVTQLSFAVNKGGEVDPTPYLIDAAFRAFYEAAPADFERLKPQDISEIVTKTRDYANARLGGDIVKDVLVGELNYVGRDDVRTNWVKKPKQ
jgi:hypothetical protein